MASSKTELEEKLRAAAKVGNVEEIVQLLDLGADIDAADKDLDGRTPLMWASKIGKVECVKVLLDRGAQFNVQDKGGRTALMMASYERKVECMKVLLDRGAQVNMQDEGGRTALMMASEAGKVECVNVLLDRGSEVNLHNEDGWTALMWASRYGHVECAKVLLDRGAQVNMQDKDENSPLLWASVRGDMECVKVLLDRGAQVNMQNKDGKTPLMKASDFGYMECVKVLLDRGAQVSVQDKDTWNLLMWALHDGRLECLKLVLDSGTHVNLQDNEGGTALMEASREGRVECVKMLLDRGAQINSQDEIGDTALHIAARTPEFKWIKEKDQISCVRALLSHPGIDINLKNSRGRTAIMDASYKSLIVFNQVAKTCNDFPADSYGKVVLCGNSGAGKSTLTQAIINISKPAATRFVKRVFGREDVIEPLTAGIIPHQVDSPYSNMVVYDLAGHYQYFSSHSACLEAISLNGPAIFLLLQDLTKDPDVITKELYYWSTMIDGVCHTCPQQPSVIVMGTHADLLTTAQLTKKLSHLRLIARRAISHQTLVDVIAVNLRKIYSGGMDQFRDLLYRTNKDVLSMSPPISMMCHMMLAFLKEKLPSEMQTISLPDLLVHLKADQDKVLNPDITAVVPLLKTLSEKGLIVFIPFDDPYSSWIVLHKESILKKVNGTLFADQSIKEYAHLASNTGIISTAIIKSTFPEYNVDMITQFMVHFELCQAVNLSQIITNMAPEGPTSSDLGPLYFIPALVNIDRPSTATTPDNSFRWSETVKSTDQFFTPRFHHVLLHRLPLEFALPAAQTTSLQSQPFNRRCDVWSGGIMWLSETGVTTIFDMSQSFQSISLTMSSPNKTDPKYLELAHSVREVIKKARQEFCPHLEVLEVVSSPPVDTLDHSNDTRVELSLLKKALLQNYTHIVDMSGKKSVAIDEWKEMEPHLSYLVEASNFTGQVMRPLEESSACQPLSEMIHQVVKQLDEAPTLPKLLCFSDRNVNIAQQI